MDEQEQEAPQDITCSGGIKLNFGALFGGRPQQDQEGHDDDSDGGA